MKRLLLLALLFLLVLSNLFALTAHDIFYADRTSLENMASLRGIDTALSEEELRNALYEREGLERYSLREEEEGTFTVNVENANYLRSQGSLTTLEGNVSLSFNYSSNETTLSADEVVIDTSSSLIIALGHVHFESQGTVLSQQISADIVTYYWEKGNIVVENASTMNERTNSNDETVNVYSVGERLTYYESGAAIYEDGYIASSDHDPLSSISASNITMLPGSDMLIENAVLNIGRVPIFYFPVFFFPGSRIVGNPAFGFNSSKGAFVNTTFEIFGRSDLIDNTQGSSFLSIFSDHSDDEESIPRGSYYVNTDDLTPFERWARESESNLAILADAYSSVGLHSAVDSTLKFFNKSLQFDTFTGIGLTFNTGPNQSHFRYYSLNSLSYSFSGLAINLSLPYYSDSNVLVDLGNRLTAFSIEPILMQEPTFPTTYSSAITAFSRTAEIRYTLPSNMRTSWLSSFSISRLRVESRYAYTNNEFKLDYIHLPQLTMSAQGSIFNFEYTDTARDGEKLDSAELFLLSDPLMYEMFKSDYVSTGHASTTYSIGMGYTVNQSLDNNHDYVNGELNKVAFNSDTSIRLTTEANIGEYLRIRDIITPSYDYNLDGEKDAHEIWSDEFALSNTVEVEIPIIGLKYTLTNRMYELKREFDGTKESIEEASLLFDEDHVSAHSIAFSKAFDTIIGTFTPSITYTIFPLRGSLTPSLGYRIGNFALSFSYRFLNDDDQNSLSFKSDLVSLSLAYNGTYVVASTALRYQTDEYRESDFFYPMEADAQLSVRTEDRRYSISEQLQWKGFDSSTGLTNYVSSLRTTLTIPYFTCYVDFSGQFNALELSTINARVNAQDLLIRAWRGRLYLSLGLSANLNIDVQNIAASSFTITPSIIFSIAEFIDFKFSFTSSNNNFGSYQESGSFSFSELWNDFLRSFDFFGDGRYNTNFNMSSIALEAVHYMQDWALHCKYSTSVVLSNNEYRFIPEFSIYLSWNTFPDLSIDEQWKQNSSNTWTRSN